MLNTPGQWVAFVLSGWTTTWPTQLLAIIWILWVVSWVIASFWSGQTRKGVMSSNLSKYRSRHVTGSDSAPAIDRQAAGGEAALAVWQRWHVHRRSPCACGYLVHLVGENPSRTFLVERDHAQGRPQVIDTGPYGMVRHPIYTGLIAGMLVTGIAVGTVTAILGAVLISLGMA